MSGAFHNVNYPYPQSGVCPIVTHGKVNSYCVCVEQIEHKLFEENNKFEGFFIFSCF